MPEDDLNFEEALAEVDMQIESACDDSPTTREAWNKVSTLSRLGASLEGMGTGCEIARTVSGDWTSAVHDGDYQWLQCVDDAGNSIWKTPMEAIRAIYTYITKEKE